MGWDVSGNGKNWGCAWEAAARDGRQTATISNPRSTGVLGLGKQRSKHRDAMLEPVVLLPLQTAAATAAARRNGETSVSVL